MFVKQITRQGDANIYLVDINIFSISNECEVLFWVSWRIYTWTKKQIFIWKFKAEQSFHILHNAFILSYSCNDNKSQVGRADFSLILEIGSYIFEKNDLSIKK